VDLAFRRHVAEKLTKGDSLPRLTLQKAVESGFRAFEPVERFLNTLEDGAYRDRPKVREEEALEALSNVGDGGEPLYRSDLLEALRLEQRQRQLRFRPLSLEEEMFNLVGSNGLNHAYKEGEETLRVEVSARLRTASSLTAVKTHLAGVRPILTRHMEGIGFSRAARLEKRSHAVYIKDVGGTTVIFTVDLNRCMQNRLLIVPVGSAPIDIFSYDDVVDLRFEANCLALMAGGRPYMRQTGNAEIAHSTAYACIALEQVAAKLDA